MVRRGGSDGIPAPAPDFPLGSTTPRKPTTLYSASVAAVLEAMKQTGVRRIVAVTAIPAEPNELKTFSERHVGHPLLLVFFGGGYEDMVRMEQLLLSGESDWTVLRPPRLTDSSPSNKYRTAVDARLTQAGKISRSDLALAVLDTVTAKSLVGDAVTVASCPLTRLVEPQTPHNHARLKFTSNESQLMPIVTPVAIDHVVLKCGNVERSLTFYVDILGLVPLRVDQWRAGKVSFPSLRINSTTIIDLFPSEANGTNVDHICLVVEPFDYAEVAAAFPGSGRGDQLYGAQGYASSVYVTDPDGIVIELRSYQTPTSTTG